MFLLSLVLVLLLSASPVGQTGDLSVVNRANSERTEALGATLIAIDALKGSFGGEVPPEDDRVVVAMRNHLMIQLDSNFWSQVDRVRSLIAQNLATSAPILIDNACGEYAHVDGSNSPAKGVTFCPAFFAADFTCQREVITHEYFHFVVGLGHHYDANTSDEAIACPHHLTEFVFEVARGEIGGCGSAAVCR